MRGEACPTRLLAVSARGRPNARLHRLWLTGCSNFTMAEVSADKAYSSFVNLECVEDAGGVPFIAFKSNARGENRPGIWARMHAHFTLRRDDFLSHYHKRSNVESTFSMMKRKFVGAVRSKTEVAIRNEVLCNLQDRGGGWRAGKNCPPLHCEPDGEADVNRQGGDGRLPRSSPGGGGVQRRSRTLWRWRLTRPPRQNTSGPGQ